MPWPSQWPRPGGQVRAGIGGATRRRSSLTHLNCDHVMRHSGLLPALDRSRHPSASSSRPRTGSTASTAGRRVQADSCLSRSGRVFAWGFGTAPFPPLAFAMARTSPSFPGPRTCVRCSTPPREQTWARGPFCTPKPAEIRRRSVRLGLAGCRQSIDHEPFQREPDRRSCPDWTLFAAF